MCSISTERQTLHQLQVNSWTAAYYNVDIPVFGNLRTAENNALCQTFMSEATHRTVLGCRAGSVVGGTPSDFVIEFEKATEETESAVCVPSLPLQTVGLEKRGATMLLKEWWDENKCRLPSALGSRLNVVDHHLFMVIEKAHTDQVSNCYYRGRESKTSLKMTGQISQMADLAINVGFSCSEDGNFGFVHLLPRADGKKWSIFVMMDNLKAWEWKSLRSFIQRVWLFVPK